MKVAVNCKILLVIILASAVAYDMSHAEFPEYQDIEGSDLFIQYSCDRCHTLGRGVFVGPDLLNVEKRYSRGDIVQWITDPGTIYRNYDKMPVNEGFPPMPPMDVPDYEAELIADYITGFDVEPGEIPETGSITGEVFNHSENDAPIKGIEVILRSYLGDRNTGEKQVLTDEYGQFVFSELQWNRSYELSINHEGNIYTTERIVFPPDKYELEMSLPVYNATRDDSDLHIYQQHIVISFEDNTMQVAEIIEVFNSGDEIYKGRENISLNLNNQTMVIDVGKNASNINLIEGLDREHLLLQDGKIYDTSAILPGLKRMILTYDINLQSGDTVLRKNPYFPGNKILILVRESANSVTINGLERGEDVAFGGQQYRRWEENNVEKSRNITIAVSKPFLNYENLLIIIPIAVFSILLIAGLLYNYLYRRRRI